MPVDSIKYVDPIFRVLESYAGDGTAFQIALIYARHARADGSRTNPSVQRIANRTQKCARTVQYHTRAMEKSGWLTLTNPGDGRFGQANCYQINRDWLKNATTYARRKPSDSTRKPGAKCASDADAIAPPVSLDITPHIAPLEGAKKWGFTAKKSAENTQILHPQYINEYIYKEKKNEEVNKTYERARAITADWFLPKKAGDWALQTFPGWTAEIVRKCAENFKAYWLPKGTERNDWAQVWRDHCQREADFLARRARSQAVAGSSGSPESKVLRERASLGLQAHPGETMEAYRRRVRAAGDAPPVAVFAVPQPTHVAMAGPHANSDSGPLSPESIALRRAAIAKAKEAAQRGERRETARRVSDRLRCAMRDTPVEPVEASREASCIDALPRSLSTCVTPVAIHVANVRAALAQTSGNAPAIDLGATDVARVSDQDHEKMIEAIAPAPCEAVTCLPSIADHEKSAPQRRDAPHVRRASKPDGERRRQRFAVFDRYRVATGHARASPNTHAARKVLHPDSERQHVVPWLAMTNQPAIRLRYLLPDATGQWR